LKIIFENDIASDGIESATAAVWISRHGAVANSMLGVRRGGNKVGEKWRKSSRSEAFSGQSKMSPERRAGDSMRKRMLPKTH
jgi:hypothetical protein